jgi:hypothetical protein
MNVLQNLKVNPLVLLYAATLALVLLPAECKSSRRMRYSYHTWMLSEFSVNQILSVWRSTKQSKEKHRP